MLTTAALVTASTLRAAGAGLAGGTLGDPTFEDPAFGPPDTGAPDGFAALFVLALLAGVAITVWKVVVARQMARESGHDPDRATGMALLTDHGLEAQYLARTLRDPAEPAPSVPDPAPPATAAAGGAGSGGAPRPVAERLRELDALRDQGLVTDAEHAARRQSILDSL